ncbi:MAG: NAD-dependent succinate-semialdehyde dehydrogenase [Abditibacteriaceae bacterium]
MQTYGLYLNGHFVQTGQSISVTNPATEEEIARVSTADEAKVLLAIGNAHIAFLSWRELTARTRGDYLLKVAAVMEARKDEIARMMTMEAGKPLSGSIAEVAGSIDHLRWFAEEGRRAYGRIIPHQTEGKRHLVIKTPVGVVGAISPWNFPLILAVRKAAPAMAAGCTVILKPASQTPLVSVLLAECMDEAGVPPGVFQIVLGDSAMIGKVLLQHPLVRKITFTGSTEVGKILIKGAAEQVKPLSLELGGHAPALVFDDCNLEGTVKNVIDAKFRNTGQSCIAANRLYVQDGIYDNFMELFLQETKNQKIGNGLDDGVSIGALIDVKALQHALHQTEEAVSQGAKVLLGGKRWGNKGYFLEPTILAEVPSDALCMNEETFAPMLPVVKFHDETDAIAQANNTRYGLSAYAFTQDINRMFRLAEHLEAGTIAINDGIPSTSNAPFGGVKQSGWGRELGSEGLEEFLEVKHISIGGN